MLSWKKLLGAVALPIIVYLFSPIKEHVLSYYQTRWYVEQNSPERSVRIRVHNLSSNASLPITVQIDNPGGKIIDFEYADPWDGPRISSLSTTRHSETLRQFDMSLKRPILVDEHLAPSSLEEIEDQLEDAALSGSVPRRHSWQGLREEMTLRNHLLWLEQCRIHPSAAHPCCMERAWETWEYLLRGIQGDEAAFWKQTAGVQLGFSDFHFVPQGNIRYVLSLPAGHSALLLLRYGSDSVNGNVNVFTDDGPGLKVRKEHDLDRPVWLMLFQYPRFNPGYGLLVVVLAILTLPLFVPLKFLNTFTLVNQALAKSDQIDAAGEWDMVHERIKFLLTDKFDYFRDLLGKPPKQIASEELFDYLRAYLRLVYRGGLGRFRNNEQLQTQISRGMLDLASR